MAEIVAPQNVNNPGQDPRWLGFINSPGGMMPPGGMGWGYRPYLTTSDTQVYRNKDQFANDARDAARANPFGRSALRVTTDAIIGKELTLFLAPDAKALGVTQDEAEAWAEMVEQLWNSAANSPACHFDAQRKQTFSGLMRTAYQEYYTGGECLGSFKWKQSSNGQRTCVYLIASERLSDPHGVMDYTGKRRMGVERDSEGAPLAYHIRQKHPNDSLLFGPPDKMQWWRIPRQNQWGRWNIIHYYEQDRVDMTRGLSAFTTALLPMRLLDDYNKTELESAALRATYAAVIESELDYDKAMGVIGSEYANAVKGNPLFDFTMRMMADNATFYRGQDLHFGKSKVSHLLPNEELKMVQGNNGHSILKDFNQSQLQILASALGVAYESLTKDYSSTNYSGARAALYDVWRSYEVQREGFIRNFAWPIFINWLEEMVALRGVIPMLGSQNFYDRVDALTYGTFETWAKPRLDPHHETNADIALYKAGALTLRDLTRTDGNLDWRKTLRARAQEKAEMDRLGLKPEDIDWDILPEVQKAEAAQTAAERPAGSGSGPQ